MVKPSIYHRLRLEYTWKFFGVLFTLFFSYFKGKKCKVYAAPFDVRLPEKNENSESASNVVQPDISVICDKSKLDDRGCFGAPDLIVEILSPFTGKRNIKDKFFLYEKHGVKEYWIIHPYEKTLQVYKLGSDSEYNRSENYGNDEQSQNRSVSRPGNRSG